MNAQVTYKGMKSRGDTISVFDNDGREIVVRRADIPKLIRLLREIQKREYGKLGLEIV